MALGFDAGLISALAQLANVGVAAYNVYETSQFNDDMIELQDEIARRKAEIEQKYVDAQTRLLTAQTDILTEKSDIEIDVMEAEANLRMLQIEREKALQASYKELEDIQSMYNLMQAQNNYTAGQNPLVFNQPSPVQTSESSIAIPAVIAAGVIATVFFLRKKS